MKRLLFAVIPLALVIPALLTLGGTFLFDHSRSPDLFLPEAYAIAIDALSKTNGYYCYQAILEGEGGMFKPDGTRVSTNGVWRFYFHNTNGSPPVITDDVCVEVRAKRAPRVLNYYEALMLKRM